MLVLNNHNLREESPQKKEILVRSTNIVGLGLLVGLLYNIFTRDNIGGTHFLLTFMVITGLVRYLVQRNLKLASLISVYGFTLVIFIASLLNGGFDGVIYIFLIFPLIMSVFLLEKRFVIINSVFIFFAGFVILFLQLNDILPTQVLFTPTQARFVIINIGIFVTLSFLITSESIRNRYYRELLASEERFRVLFDEAPEGIVLYDYENDVIIDINRTQLSNYKLSKEEYLQGFKEAKVKNLSDEMNMFLMMEKQPDGQDTQNLARDTLQRAINGENVNLEWYELDVFGDMLEFQVNCVRMPFNGKDVIRVSYQDISDKKQAQSALKSSQERFRSLFEDSRDGIVISTVDGQILDINQAALDMFGYLREDLTSLMAQDLYNDPQDRKMFAEMIKRTGGIEDLTLKMRRKDRSTLLILLSSVPSYDTHNQINGYRTIFRDVTDKDRFQKQLKKSEEKFRSLFDSTPIPVVVADMSQIKHRLDNMGIHSGEILYVYCREHPEFIEELLDMAKIRLANKQYLQVFGYENYNDVEDQAFVKPILPITLESWVATFSNWLNNQVSYIGEVTLRRIDLIEKHTICYRRLLPGSENSWEEAIGLVVDRTEQKQTQQKLIEVARFEALGKMAGGVGHDLNNILTGVVGYNHLILDTTSVPEIHEFADAQKVSIDQGVNLVSNLLSFSRRQKIEYLPFSPVSAIEYVLGILSKMVERSNITLIRNYGSDSQIVGNEGEFSQICMNVLVNAIEAIGLDGSITISTMSTDDYYELNISDNGPGIPQDIVDKVTDFLFTTKASGSGMGLFIVSSILHDIGGTFTIESTTGKGTNIQMQFPFTWNNRNGQTL